MTWACVLRPSEMATFRRCRRAWDLGSRIRQNLVPAVPPRVFDFDRAIHDALAVYYYPAMDDWDKAIVRPLALKAFLRAMDEGRAHFEAVAEATAEQDEAFGEARELGQAILTCYFDWAAPQDALASIFSDQEYWAPIPCPDRPGEEMVDHRGHEVRYLGRVDQLFSDHNDEYWIAQHRLVAGEWAGDEDLLLDLPGLTDLWATELTYPQLKIAGIVYNELRTDLDAATIEAANAPGATDYGASTTVDGRHMLRSRHVHTRRSPMTPSDAAAAEMTLAQQAGDPGDFISARTTGDWCRRTHVRRGRASVRNVGLMVAAQVAELVNLDLPVYPNPSLANCAACAFARPCTLMSEGRDPAAALAGSFRERTPEEGEEERLRWSIGRAQTRVVMSTDGQPNTVNFHWG